MSTKKPYNEDPSKYVYRKRNGEWVRFDRQVERWSKYRKEPYQRQTKLKLGRPKGGRKPIDVTEHDFF